MKLRLFISEKQTVFNQEFQIMAEIAKAIFGPGKDKPNEKVVVPQTGAEALAAFGSMFGGNGVKLPPPQT